MACTGNILPLLYVVVVVVVVAVVIVITVVMYFSEDNLDFSENVWYVYSFKWLCFFVLLR